MNMGIIQEKFRRILKNVANKPIDRKLLQEKMINGFRFTKDDMGMVLRQLEKEKYIIKKGRKYKIRL